MSDEKMMAATRPARAETSRYQWTALAAPGGVFLTVKGSATKLVRVKAVFLDKPSVPVVLSLLRASTAWTGGTAATALVATPHDSRNAAATVVVTPYTAAPTGGGTLVGGGLGRVSVATNQVAGDAYGERGAQEITLRGVGESLALSTDVAATLSGYCEITEE